MQRPARHAAARRQRVEAAHRRRDLFGRALPVAGSAGDQQAALVGHGALKAGDAKITYGTGAFLVANVGAAPVASTRRL